MIRKSLLALAVALVSFSLYPGEAQRGPVSMQKDSRPDYLYKVVSPEQWQESLLRKQVVISSIDKEFIHFAKEDQIGHVVQKFWKGADYLILKIVPKELTGRLVYETNPGGSTKYFHLYEGTIPLKAVIEVLRGQTVEK